MNAMLETGLYIFLADLYLSCHFSAVVSQLQRVRKYSLFEAVIYYGHQIGNVDMQCSLQEFSWAGIQTACL